MSAIIGIVIRLLALGGVSVSPFAAGAIVALVVFGGAGVFTWRIYQAGAEHEAGKCEAAALRSELEAMRRDRDAARAAERDALDRVASIERQGEADKEGTAKYVGELERKAAEAAKAGKASDSVVCGITDDDARVMRPRPGAGVAGARAAGEPGILDAARRGAARLKGR